MTTKLKCHCAKVKHGNIFTFCGEVHCGRFFYKFDFVTVSMNSFNDSRISFLPDLRLQRLELVCSVLLISPLR